MPEIKIECKECYQMVLQDFYLGHLIQEHDLNIAQVAVEQLLKVTERVKFILEKSKSARNSDQFLILTYYRYFPSTSGIRLIYDANTKSLAWNRNMTYAEFLELTQPDTITRAGRSVRHDYPDLQGTERMVILRKAKEDSYKMHFGAEGGFRD